MLIYIFATILLIVFAWVIGVRRALREAEEGSILRIPRIFEFILKYVSPLYLIVVFVIWIKGQGPTYIDQIQGNPVVVYTLLFILALTLFFMVCVFLCS